MVPSQNQQEVKMITYEEQQTKYQAWLVKSSRATEKQQIEELSAFSLGADDSLAVGAKPENLGTSIIPEALPMPNGSSLWFSIHLKDRKHELKGSKNTRVFQLALRNTVKEFLPSMFCRTNAKYTVCVADFDKLDLIKGSKYGKAVSSWADFEKVLNLILPDNEQLVLTSPSGKRKIIFFVEGKLSIKQIKDFLLSKLGKDLFSCLDASHSALSKVFINLEMYNTLITYLYSGIYIHTINIEEVYENMEVIGKDLQVSDKWVDYKLNMPKFQKNLLSEKLLKFMAGNPYLAIRGIKMNQDWLGKRYNKSQRDIWYAIENLLKCGLIIKTKNYSVGNFANEYAAVGDFKDWLEKLITRRTGKIITAKNNYASKSISDGEWAEMLWKNTKNFSNYTDWIRWAESLTGINKNDRLKQAKSIGKFCFKGKII